jgi:subtilisin family serine protease
MLAAVALLCGAIIATAADGPTAPPQNASMPRLQTRGDLQPLLARAKGNGWRTHSCTNGTEFIVTLGHTISGADTVALMNQKLGNSHSANRCRSLRHAAFPEAQANVITVCIPPEHGVDEHLQMLLAMKGVYAVEENVAITRTTTPAPWVYGTVPWHLDRIAEKYLPLDGTYNVPYTGQGVRVYLTDTGTDASDFEFQGRVTTGYSTIPGEVADYDADGHGTHTAGLAGSYSFGVAKKVSITPVKVFPDSGGPASNADIIEGINWIISQERGHTDSAVLSMSLGMPSSGFYAGDQALAQAVQAGIIPVVAAGNSAADACGYWPAQSVSAITVGATDINDYRSSFSNYGSCVDVYAPGTDITSTVPNNCYEVMSGTSMATPIVAGVVAMYLEAHPNTLFTQMKNAIVRNAVGNHNAAPANLMVLVQAKQDTVWSLLATAPALAPRSAEGAPRPSVLPSSLPMALGIGCVATLAVFAIVHVRASKTQVKAAYTALVI